LQLSSKDIALAAVFASLHTVFSSWNLFPLVGAPGRFIQLGTLMAPVIGVILGPWLTLLSLTIGGTIGFFVFQTGPFGPFSFLPQVAAGYSAGLLSTRRRWVCALLYLGLLLVLAFYPPVGPAWLWPPFLWVHMVAALLMCSPLQPKMESFLRQPENAVKLASGLGVTLFLATLFGHAVGTIMFEVVYWPSFISEMGAWKANWQLLMWLYPVERGLIVLLGTLVGTGLLKALRVYGFKTGVES
jgi:uncharacterized membrane protein